MNSDGDNDDESEFKVGIFADLDNVAPQQYTRASATHFIQPLLPFGRQTLDGQVERLHGWGNKSTHTFGGKLEDDALQEAEYNSWDGNSAVTGYDKNGILRCGVCGSKITINKKDRAQGRTAESKLEKHMETLHAREQKKTTQQTKSGL
jgi:hypothetical protein